MKRIRIVAVGFAFFCMTSLLLGRVHPFGDAASYAAKTTPSILMEHSAIPPEVRSTLAAKCADCHSMQTRLPVYGRFAPLSWMMERDIVKGRAQINFSLWDTYSTEQQEMFKAEIVQQTKTHRMPLPQYRMIHWDTRITDADVLAFTRWARNTPGTPADLSEAQPAEDGDPVRGKEVFEKRCTGCHAMETDREGPHLRGVYGRTSGTVPGFSYSQALVDAHIVWDEKSLEQWLTDPDTLVPNNNMEFHVPKPQERRDLVQYLKQSSK